MRGNRVVVGVFEFLDDAMRAVDAARGAQLDYKVYSPVPSHELEEKLMPEKSPVRIVTLIGAISGLVFGFALTIWCSLDFPLRTSAKPIISVPAFTVIAYETTILLGALFTLAALLFFCKLPHLVRAVGYDPRFSADRFGVVVGCDLKDTEDVRARLLAAGAEEATIKEAL